MSKTLTTILGERFPRLMPVSLAGAYVSMSETKFRAAYGFLIREHEGRNIVDKRELDSLLDSELHGGQLVSATLEPIGKEDYQD